MSSNRVTILIVFLAALIGLFPVVLMWGMRLSNVFFPEKPEDLLSSLFVLSPVLAAAASGLFLAQAGFRIETYRLLKIFALSLPAYILCSLFTAAMLILSVVYVEGASPEENLFTDWIYLGLAGAAMFSIVAVPLLLLFSVLIERLTRNHSGKSFRDN